MIHGCDLSQYIPKSNVQSGDIFLQSYDQLSLMCEASGVGLWDWDVVADTVVYSAQWRKQLGYDEDALSSDWKDWASRIHTDDRIRVVDAVKHYVSHCDPSFEIEYRILHNNGDFRWMSAHAALQRDANGSVTHFLGAQLDITSRKLSEESQRTSYQYLLSCISLAPLSIAIFDINMRYLATSQRWVAEYGRGHSDLIGKSHYEIHPDIPDAWRNVHQRGFAGETVTADEDLWVLGNGTELWLNWSVTPWRTVTGAIGGIIISAEDITERKRASDALRKSEAHFRELFEQATDGILVADAAGRFVDINSAGCAQLGYTREEVLLLKISDIVAPQEIPRIAPEIARLAGGNVVRTQWRVRRKDGSEFIADISSKQLPDGRLQGLVRDVTDAIQTQTLLQERQHFLEGVLNAEPGTVYIFDLASNSNVYVNRHWLTEYGYSPEETAAMGASLVSRIFMPEDRARIEAHHESWRGTPTDECREIDYRVRTKAGELRWLHSREIVFSRDEVGNVRQILGIATDITERQRDALALEESEARFRAIFEGAGVALIELNCSALFAQISKLHRRYGNDLGQWCTDNPNEIARLAGFVSVIDVNRAALSMFDITGVDDVSKNVVQFFNADSISALSEQVIALANGSTRFSVEVQFKLPQNAELRTAMLSVTVAKTAVPWERLSVSLLEITELKRYRESLEEKVAERTALLLNTNKELESFSYSISHDLRAPLRSLTGFSQVLLDDYADKLDSTARDYLTRLKSAALRMNRLMDALLKLSRITRAELAPSRVNLSEFATEVIAGLRQAHPDRNIDVSIESGLTAAGDPALLRIAIENLLDNAWKYTSKSQSACITVNKKERNNGTIFCVCDNGAGFDMRYAGKLFGAFQRFHAVDEFPGTGIGLATVSRIIHRHGGKIWAEAEVDKGACFYFTLGKLKVALGS